MLHYIIGSYIDVIVVLVDYDYLFYFVTRSRRNTSFPAINSHSLCRLLSYINVIVVLVDYDYLFYSDSSF